MATFQLPQSYNTCKEVFEVFFLGNDTKSITLEKGSDLSRMQAKALAFDEIYSALPTRVEVMHLKKVIPQQIDTLSIFKVVANLPTKSK